MSYRNLIVHPLGELPFFRKSLSYNLVNPVQLPF
jgi:hypothetical protein